MLTRITPLQMQFTGVPIIHHTTVVWLFDGWIHTMQVSIPKEQVYAIKEGLPVKEAATEYEGQLLRLPKEVLPRNSEGAFFLLYTHSINRSP